MRRLGYSPREGGRRNVCHAHLLSNAKADLSDLVPDHLLKLFPTTGPSGREPGIGVDEESPDSMLARVKLLQSQVEFNEALEDSQPGIKRIGAQYPLWTLENELPPHAKLLFDAASLIICTSCERLLYATREVEVMYRESEWLRLQKRILRMKGKSIKK